MSEAPEAVQRLAARLRALREEAGARQRDLADAVGVKPPTISSWESLTMPRIPPQDRLPAVAAFLAARRSPAGAPEEAALLHELTHLREEACGSLEVGALTGEPSARPHSVWDLRDDLPLTVVCARREDGVLKSLPCASPDDADYERLSTFNDIDALVSLYGQLRALHPRRRINLRTTADLHPDMLSGHIVLLGQAAWNPANRMLLSSLQVPVRREPGRRPGDPDRFVVPGEDGTGLEIAPELAPGPSTGPVTGPPTEGSATDPRPADGAADDTVPRYRMTADVGLVVRGPSPYNLAATLTICSGIHTRGTYGMVRISTDRYVGARNQDWLDDAFAGATAFAMLVRVPVFESTTASPDLHNAELVRWTWRR